MTIQTATLETPNSSFTAKEMRSFLRLLPDDAKIKQSTSEDRYNFDRPKTVTKLHASWTLPVQ